ncbi:Uncharacterised protein [Myroides odoratimimus]|nr:Uncharacterised protein [Myroides odoratimimus]
MVIARSSLRTLFVFVFFLVIMQNSFGQVQTSANTQFDSPYIDMKEWRDVPIRHLYVHGGFKGTDTRFSFYFPVKDLYEGRFYQYITPFPDNENLSQNASFEEDKIGFSLTHGAYFIETNGGGKLKPNESQLITAYLANAACASYSRIIAAEIYGDHRPYGYCFGGSGGAYRTIGSIENTDGVWDGAVPYIMGSPMAIPNVFSVRMHAMRILKDKLLQVVDALEPGGSGDMYEGLNEIESAALKEVTEMGFEPKSWFGYKTMGVHGFSAIYQGMVSMDPEYFVDFWNKPGYLGYDQPNSFIKDRITQFSRIKAIVYENEAISLGLIPKPTKKERGTADLAWKGQGKNEDEELPIAFVLEDTLIDIDFLGGDLKLLDGDHADRIIQISKIDKNYVVIGVGEYPFISEVKVGDRILIDNSNFLAAQTYHRHQIPSVKEYPVWNQYLDLEGKPLYPQRKLLIAPIFTKSASGVLPSGKIKGKVIVLSSLWDREAFPWQADWYRSRVIEHLDEKIDENFRLWYTDRALHGDATLQEDPNRTISYLGVLQQALLDLSQWVEKGIEPPQSTQYKVENGQIIVSEKADERKGIQPIANLRVKDKKNYTTKVGKPVKFEVNIELPPHTGYIVRVEWDFENTGTFTKGKFRSGTSNTHILVKHKHTFKTKGTYFPTVRVVSQREGMENTHYTLIQNLDRVRVIVD